MDLFATWLPPAAIIAVILFANNQTNKRINDINKRIDDTNRNIDNTNRKIDNLREYLLEQMKNDHAHLAKQIELGDQRLSEKIDNVDKRLTGMISSLHAGLESLCQDFKLLRQDFIRHLESHIDSDKKEK